MMRLVLAAAVAASVLALWLWESAEAFAAGAAIVSLLVSLRLEHPRFQLERPFFVGPSERARTLVSMTVAGVNAVARALAVGVVGLFSFATPRMFEDIAGVDLGQVERDFVVTAALMAAFVGAGVVASALIDRGTGGRGHRWTFYRFTVVFGVLFSAVIFVVGARTAEAERPVFAPISWEAIQGALQDVAVGGVVACAPLAVADRDAADGVRRPDGLVERRLWRVNGCGRTQTPQLCEGYRISGEKTWALGDTLYNAHGCGGAKEAIAAGKLLGVSAILDEFFDQVLRAVIASLLGDRGPVTEAAAVVLAVLISPDILQGLVIGSFAAAISLVLFGGRVRD